MVVIFVAALLIPGISDLFALEPPPPAVMLLIAGIVGVTYPLMHLCRRLAERWRASSPAPDP